MAAPITILFNAGSGSGKADAQETLIRETFAEAGKEIDFIGSCYADD